MHLPSNLKKKGTSEDVKQIVHSWNNIIIEFIWKKIVSSFLSSYFVNLISMNHVSMFYPVDLKAFTVKNHNNHNIGLYTATKRGHFFTCF